jgi:hypothetical protein
MDQTAEALKHRTEAVAGSGMISSKKAVPYSTVTDFARFRGWSTSVPLAMAV